MPPRRSRLRGRIVLVLGGAAFLVGLYAATGFYGGPWLVDGRLADLQRAAPGREVSRDSVRFNPFTLRGEIAGLALSDTQAGFALGADRIVFDLAAESLSELRPVIGFAVIERPAVRLDSVRFRQAGPDSPSREAAREGMRIDRLEIVDGVLAAGRTIGAGEAAFAARFDGRAALTAGFAAAAAAERPTLALENVALAVSELSWTPAAALTVTAEPLAADGNVSFALSGDGVVVVDGRLAIDGAQVSVRDSGVQPPQTFALSNTAMLILAGDAGAGPNLDLEGRLAGAGAARMTIRSPRPGNAVPDVSLRAGNLPVSVLSAYSAAALGRRLIGGEADLDLEYGVAGDGVEGLLRLTIRGLAPAQSALSRGPSLEMAIALLESNDGVIEIDVPFAGAEGSARAAVLAALAARVSEVADAPFDVLARLVGTERPMSSVPFDPGAAALDESALEPVMRLAEALTARMRLGVRIPGAYAPSADRDALARQQIELHVQLATAGPGARGRPARVDFRSARVHDVLDEFAGERLPAERLASIASRYDCADNAECRRLYYERIFDALAANEEISTTALSRLGRFRAQSIAQALVQLGIADERIELAPSVAVGETPSRIEVPIALTTREQISPPTAP